MRLHRVVIGLLGIAVGCGGGKLNPGGNAGNPGPGTAGATGAAGVTGFAGTIDTGVAGFGDAGAVGTAGATGLAGAGGYCPTSVSGDVVELMIVGSDGTPVSAAVSASVTVTGIGSCATSICDAAVTADASKIALASASGQWTLYLRDTAMPSDFIKVGDAFDLAVDAKPDATTVLPTVDQTVTLSRNGQLLVFAANLQRFFTLPLPNIPAFQISVADGGAACTPQNGCLPRFHDAEVTVGGYGRQIPIGVTATVGGLAVTNGAFTEWLSGCGDTPKSQVLVAGFRPPSSGTGSLPTCTPGDGQSYVVEFAIVGNDGMPIKTPTSAAVTVASVLSCEAAGCPSLVSGVYAGSISGAAQQITLNATGFQSWTLYLRNSAMPSDFFKVGDKFDMTVDAGVDSAFYQTINQTLELARGGDLMVFAASLGHFYQLPVPQLDAFAVQVSDAGAFCMNGSTSIGCIYRPHYARVAVGGDSAMVAGGQTATVGWLSVTNGSFTELADTGSCDSKSGTVMAGFRSP